MSALAVKMSLKMPIFHIRVSVFKSQLHALLQLSDDASQVRICYLQEKPRFEFQAPSFYRHWGREQVRIPVLCVCV